jgi:hypothetical protein
VFATAGIGASFLDAGKASVRGPCPRILTLGYLSRASVRNLGPEPSESTFTPGEVASVRKLGVGSGDMAADRGVWLVYAAGIAPPGRIRLL